MINQNASLATNNSLESKDKHKLLSIQRKFEHDSHIYDEPLCLVDQCALAEFKTIKDTTQLECRMLENNNIGTPTQHQTKLNEYDVPKTSDQNNDSSTTEKVDDLNELLGDLDRIYSKSKEQRIEQRYTTLLATNAKNSEIYSDSDSHQSIVVGIFAEKDGKVYYPNLNSDINT